MQSIIRRQIAHALFLSLALPACGADAVDVEMPEDVSVVDAAVTSASTGQGIMVDVDVAGSLALVTNRIYEFNEAAAAEYFTNRVDYPLSTPRCIGGCFFAVFCPPPSNLPAEPPSERVLEQVVQGAACTFLDGGSLLPWSYTQTASFLNDCGVLYAQDWRYQIEPTTSSVNKLTAWDLKDETSSGNTASINVKALIAGESVLSSKAQPRKYSFSLLASDGTVRVQDLAVSLDGAPPTSLVSTYVQNAPGAKAGDPGALDFNYVTNAGSNGNLSLLADGDARTILNTDSFAGNQDGGADGRALAAVITAPLRFDLPVGDHSLVLTGKVKDNSGQSSSDLSVSSSVHIVAPGCGSN